MKDTPIALCQGASPSAHVRLEAINAFAKRLSRSRDYVYKKARTDPSFPKLIRIDGRTFVSADEADAWLKQQLAASRPVKPDRYIKMGQRSAEARRAKKEAATSTRSAKRREVVLTGI